MPTAMVSTMPYCNGSTPTRVAIGSRIGAAIRIAGIPSRMKPTTIITTTVTSRNSVGLCNDVNALASVRPSPSMTMACDTRLEAETMNSTIPAVSAASRSAMQLVRHPMVRYTTSAAAKP